MKDRVLQIRRPNASAPRPYDKAPVPAISQPYEPKAKWALYSAKFPWVPQTAGLEASKTGELDAVGLGGIDAAAGEVVEFRGHIQAEATGNFEWVLETNSDAIFRIHDAVVIDHETEAEGKQATSGSILLSKGVHPFTLTVRAGVEPRLELKQAFLGASSEN